MPGVTSIACTTNNLLFQVQYGPNTFTRPIHWELARIKLNVEFTVNCR